MSRDGYLPPGVEYSDPNFNDPTHCEDCERELNDDLCCDYCDEGDE